MKQAAEEPTPQPSATSSPKFELEKASMIGIERNVTVTINGVQVEIDIEETWKGFFSLRPTGTKDFLGAVEKLGARAWSIFNHREVKVGRQATRADAIRKVLEIHPNYRQRKWDGSLVPEAVSTPVRAPLRVPVVYLYVEATGSVYWLDPLDADVLMAAPVGPDNIPDWEARVEVDHWGGEPDMVSLYGQIMGSLAALTPKGARR